MTYVRTRLELAVGVRRFRYPRKLTLMTVSKGSRSDRRRVGGTRVSDDRGTAVPLEVEHRLGCHALDDDRCRFNRMDEPGRLAKPDSGVVRIAQREGLSVTWALNVGIALELVFATVPSVGERIAADSRREASRPRYLAGDVRHVRAQRTVAIRFDD